jgi:protein required for attachment to host cells
MENLETLTISEKINFIDNDNLNEVENVNENEKTQKENDKRERNKINCKLYYEKHRRELIDLAKQRNKENPEKLKEYQRSYKEKNAEKLNEIRKQKFECNICKGKFTYSNYNSHIMSFKHRDKVAHPSPFTT